MAFKFFVFCALVAVVNCGFIGSPYVQYAAAPTIVKTIQQAPVVVKKVELDAPAQYSFEYSVNDASTGDVKSQQETRNGDDVTGTYSLIDADGLKRTVDYTASEANGFNAVVRREGAPAPAPVVVKKIIAPAPTITKVFAPAPAYHAPAYYQAPAIQKVVAAPSASTFTISSPYVNYGW